MAFTACQTNEVDNIEVSRKVSFSATAESTRTVFGDKVGTAYPTLWTTNKDVKVSYNYGTGKNATVAPSGDQKSAAFTVDITEDTSVTSHAFYALSPASASVSFSSSFKSGTINIPSSQAATATSCDEAAQILAAKSSTMAAFSTNVNLAFSHVTAYGKMSLTNFTLGASETINSISLTAEENLTGRYFYYYEDNDPQSAGELVANSASKTLSITPATNTTISDIWFACAPADLTSTTLQVVVTTTSGTYTKAITMPATDALKFVAGEVSKFNVDMNGITVSSPVEYTLATSLSDLKIGDNVIIAASSYNYAIGTQNANNRAAEAVTKSNSKISDPGAGVQIFAVEEGTTTGTVAFKAGAAGYLYAASSSSNYLRTQETNNANGLWNVAIARGVATITAQGEYTRNTIRYNQGNNPVIFSCYASSATTGSAVAIYTDGTGTTAIPLPTPTVSATTAAATGTATTADNGNGQAATLNGSYTVSNLGDGTVTCGFEYKLSTAESYTSVTATPTNSTPFSYDLTGLTTGSEYTFRAWASLDGGTTKVYGATTTFTPKVAGDTSYDVSYDFTNISDFSSWSNSYAEHNVTYTEAKVTFVSANKQSSTITTQPVTKGGDVTLKMTNGGTITSATFVCTQWTTKAQTITLHYSTNGGTSYESTGTTSTNFTITKASLPANTNAVKITFSSSSNQVGIASASITYKN